MASTYHSFGEVVVFAGVGVADALVAVGYSAKPGTIEEVFEEAPRMMDGAGQEPADIQHMGSHAIITVELGSWDDTVLGTVKTRSAASGNIGALLATGGYAFALYLPTTTDLPWYFPVCKLENPRSSPGMKSYDHYLRFRAWKPMNATATTTAGTALYTRAAP